MEKKEKEFIEENKDFFDWGSRVFGDYIKEYAFFFKDYPKNFEALKNLKQSYPNLRKAFFEQEEIPFGFDQFLILAPRIEFNSDLRNIVLGKNTVLQNFLKYDHSENTFTFLELKKIAKAINNHKNY